MSSCAYCRNTVCGCGAAEFKAPAAIWSVEVPGGLYALLLNHVESQNRYYHVKAPRLPMGVVTWNTPDGWCEIRPRKGCP